MTYVNAPRDTTMQTVGAQQQPATDRQVSYARSLVQSRDVLPGLSAAEALEWFDSTLREHGMTKGSCSRLIDRAKASRVRQHSTPVGGPAPAERQEAAPGFYVRGDEAFKVQRNKAGTHTYAKRWDGHGWEYAPGVGTTLADLTPMTAEQAAHLGLASGRCINCLRTLGGESLSAKVSAVIGYGETCAGHNGWPYPTGAAAQRAYLAENAPA